MAHSNKSRIRPEGGFLEPMAPHVIILFMPCKYFILKRLEKRKARETKTPFLKKYGVW